MDRFVDLTLSGISDGAVYAAVALSLVLIWRSTRIVNFAQSAMLMVTTFVAWSVVHNGGSYWLALLAAIGSGLVLGAVVERLLIRPVEGGPPLNAVIVCLGVLVFLEAAAGMVYGGSPRSFAPDFDIRGYVVSGRRVLFSPADAFTVGAVLVLMLGLGLLFTRTSVGLRMRAAAFAPEVARMNGVRVGRTLTLGWALATAVGALAGVLVAPSTFVGPTQFEAVLVFGFTAAVIGGLESPVGAVVGGVLLGLALSYVSGYAGSDVVTFGSLSILVAVLMVRPNGIFASSGRRRV